MSGPWEKYGSLESTEEAGPWTKFQEKVDTTDPNYIAKGDVEARRAQGAAATAKEQKSQPAMQREYYGGPILKADNPGQAVLNALKGFGSELIGGIGDIVQGGATARDEGLLKGLGQAGMGALRAIGSPAAPFVDASTDAAEGHKNLMTKAGLSPEAADIGAGITQSIMDVGAPMALGGLNPFKNAGIAEDLKPWASSFQSKRALKDSAKAELASSTERTKTAVDDIRKAADDKVANIEGAKEAYTESVESIAEAGERSIPSASDIRSRFAKNAPLGEDVGKGFKETYQTELGVEKQRFNKRYDDALKGTDDIEVDPSPYQAAQDMVLGEKGVSRPLPTQAERVAAKAKSVLDVAEDSEEQIAKMRGDIARSADPASRKYQEDALKEYLASGRLSERPTVSEMVKEMQRLKAGQRVAVQMKNDNLTRQFNTLIDGIKQSIPEDVIKSLDEVNTAYRNEFVPLFGRKSVTRAIADGSPQSVVDSIILPASSKKSVETITRARELIQDPEQWQNVTKAFTNKMVEGAFENGMFAPEKLIRHWKRFADPTGTNNKVLRTAYGADYDDMASVVRQLESAQAQPLSKVAEQLTKNYGKTADDAIKRVRGGAATSIKNAETAQKVVQKQLEKKIAELSNTAIGKLEGKVQSIGTGILYSGALRGNLFTATIGGLGIVSAKGVGKLLETVQGRNLFKAMLRGTPGTAQAAATSRQIQNFLKVTEEKDGR